MTREPTILGPHGEGYCPVCLFVVGLTATGLLEAHSRGSHSYGGLAREECKGTGRRPPKVTPYASRKAAFRVKAQDVVCPGCGRSVRTAVAGGVRVYARHYPAEFQTRTLCPFYMRAVQPEQ